MSTLAFSNVLNNSRLRSSSNARGGVSVEFDAPMTGGELTAQQIPFAGLTPEVIDAAAQNTQFLAATEELEGELQIWDVDFTGDLAGTEVELIFAYDESPFLTAGIDETTLGIWHYNSTLGDWVFGGVVDPVANTISFTTSSFSPFVVGTGVIPEPTSILLTTLAVLFGLGATARRRRC